MTKIQKNRIKKLVNILRSGKYKQCRSTLFATDDNGPCKYCILGLMILVSHHEDEETLRKKWFSGGAYDRLENRILPKYYGIRDKTFKELYELNDRFNYTFKDFADMLEKEYLTI